MVLVETPLETVPLLITQSEIAAGPINDHHIFKVGDAALSHRVLPANVAADGLFQDFRIILEKRGLHAPNFSPGKQGSSFEINQCLERPIASAFVCHYKGFAPHRTPGLEANHFALGRLMKLDK